MPERRSTELAGLTAIVTGSSSGIGKAMVLELAAAGAHCIIHANHSVDAAQAVANDARESGVQALVLQADVSNDHDRQRLVREAIAWRGRVDVWINNAGADVLTGDAAGWSFERKLEQLWNIDVQGTIALSRLIGEHMKQRTRGVILNIGWDQAQHGMAGDSGELFATTKGAIMSFTKSLARSLAPHVRVNCIAPGWIKTSWGEGTSEYWQNRARHESLLGRWGLPEDVAAVARFLASPSASFITGQIVDVNGGFNHSSS